MDPGDKHRDDNVGEQERALVTFDSVGVIGGGAWGTALAQTLRLAGRRVRLWAREAEVAAEINASHSNSAFLPGVTLDAGLEATTELADIAAQDAVLMVAPAQHVRAVAGELAAHLPAGKPVVLCAKGLEQATGKLLGEVLAETIPHATQAVLSGPSFAADVARGLPAALTLATADEALGRGAGDRARLPQPCASTGRATPSACSWAAR